MRLKAEVLWHRNYLDASDDDQHVMMNNRILELMKENEKLIREKVNAHFLEIDLLHIKSYQYHCMVSSKVPSLERTGL